MRNLPEMLRKARGSIMKRGVVEQDADDLVQEAFLKVDQYQRTHEVQSEEALLVTTATNLARDRHRRQLTAPFVDAPDNLHTIIDSTPNPEEIVRSQARLRRLAEGLDLLSERTRRILLRRRLDGLTYAEIGAIEHMSVAAVEKQVARATLQLLGWMDQW